MAMMLTLAPPLFQRCGDGDDNDAGPLLPSFRDLGLATMTTLAPPFQLQSYPVESSTSPYVTVLCHASNAGGG